MNLLLVHPSVLSLFRSNWYQYIFDYISIECTVHTIEIANSFVKFFCRCLRFRFFGFCLCSLAVKFKTNYAIHFGRRAWAVNRIQSVNSDGGQMVAQDAEQRRIEFDCVRRMRGNSFLFFYDEFDVVHFWFPFHNRITNCPLQPMANGIFRFSIRIRFDWS